MWVNRRLINEKINLYTEHILELKTTNREFTITNLIDKVNGISSKYTVHQLFDVHIEELRKELLI